MPTLELSHKDLCSLIGKPIPKDQVADALLYAKCELDTQDGDVLHVDAKDTNRPDLWSAEGIAREIAGRLGRPGLPSHRATKPVQIVAVTAGDVHPFATAAIIRDVTLTEAALSQMIQLQEKISTSFGRGRREMCAGAYDLDLLRFPVAYTTKKPEDIRFVPLGFTQEMTVREMLATHPKGKEYGHLLTGAARYPVWTDATGAVLSLVPITNAAGPGTVTTKTRNLFIECTGTSLPMLQTAITVMAAALADRGGTVEAVTLRGPGRPVISPDFTPKRAVVALDQLRVTGLDLSGTQAVSLLRQARTLPVLKGPRIEVSYPAYRQDIMHARDLVEDLLISAGYGEIEPVVPRLATRGAADRRELLTARVAEAAIGAGLQEVMSYILTNKDALFSRMQLPPGRACEIANPVSATWSVFRTGMLPSLLEFLSKNKHVEYPQQVFEIGDCVLPDDRQETGTLTSRKLGIALTDVRAGYESIAAVLDVILRTLGVRYTLAPTSHTSFLPGRVAAVLVNDRPAGHVGEIHPQALNNWGLEKPVAAAEIDLAALETA
ncbi:MAG: phenylalanine--tRNA ligase subunit beta [Candidatus Aenigmarchaeota archaeon]|nr:phenylalanine--tRNA ligase subunit beta [Candidatus Aenigmarchaeota archaeon]